MSTVYGISTSMSALGSSCNDAEGSSAERQLSACDAMKPPVGFRPISNMPGTTMSDGKRTVGFLERVPSKRTRPLVRTIHLIFDLDTKQHSDLTYEVGETRNWSGPQMIGSRSHTGCCRCGAVRMAAHTEPFWRSYCHCADCRRQSGAPVMAFVGFREPQIVWYGKFQEWSINHATRSFCGHCGSQVAYRDDRLPGETYLVLGFMDEPERYTPMLHAFWDRRMAFLHLTDELPRYDGFSVER